MPAPRGRPPPDGRKIRECVDIFNLHRCKIYKYIQGNTISHAYVNYYPSMGIPTVPTIIPRPSPPVRQFKPPYALRPPGYARMPPDARKPGRPPWGRPGPSMAVRLHELSYGDAPVRRFKAPVRRFEVQEGWDTSGGPEARPGPSWSRPGRVAGGGCQETRASAFRPAAGDAIVDQFSGRGE